MAESEGLISTVAQIKNLEEVGASVEKATANWEIFQEQSVTTAESASLVVDQMNRDLQELRQVLQKSQEFEVSHLRLEAEKLRQAEGHWVQTTILILDHIFALHKAAVRSREERVIRQMDQFQGNILELIRRVGLTPVGINPDDNYDPDLHQIVEGTSEPSKGTPIADLIIPGYTYQGRSVRKPVVLLEGQKLPAAAAPVQVTPNAEAGTSGMSFSETNQQDETHEQGSNQGPSSGGTQGPDLFS